MVRLQVIAFGPAMVQLAKSINNLKICWKQIQAAPEDIQQLIRDVEMFGLILTEVEGGVDARFVDRPRLTDQKSILWCKEASEELDILVRSLRRDMDSSSQIPGSAKMAIPKNKIEEYRSRLKNAIRLLLSTQQCYTRALVQAQDDSKDKIPPPHMLKPQIKSRRNNFEWRFGVPSWITIRGLELAGLRAPGGWTFSFRVYNTLTIHSKATRFASSGNIQGLQDLFASREATPFDRVGMNGFTLLHYVRGPTSEKVFQFLLNQGADQSISGTLNEPHTPLAHLVWSGSQNPNRPLLPSMRVLLSRSDDILFETPEETIKNFMSDFHGTAEDFMFLQRECCPAYYKFPQSTRVIVAARMASGVWDAEHMPDLIRAALGKDPLTIEDIQVEYPSRGSNSWRNITLVHSIARKIGQSLADIACKERRMAAALRKARKNKQHYRVSPAIGEHRKKQLILYESWNALFCELLAAGIDIHNIVGKATPFSSFLTEYFTWCNHEEVAAETVDAAIKIWLGDLQATGLDLKHFGQTEKRLCDSGDVDKDFHSNSRGRNGGSVRLINFTYGSSPDDWHLWMSERSDAYVGDFWRLIRRQEEVMPGAWPEDLPTRHKS